MSLTLRELHSRLRGQRMLLVTIRNDADENGDLERLAENIDHALLAVDLLLAALERDGVPFSPLKAVER